MELKDNSPIIEDSDTEEDDYLEDNAEQLNSPENRTRLFARDWFEDLYEDSDPFTTNDQFFTDNDLMQDLYSIAQTDKSHYLPTDVTQAFLDELLKFVTFRSQDPKDHDQLSAFIVNIQERLFSVSPCLINHLPLPEQILTTAKFSRQPETQGWMGSTMVGELTDELDGCSEADIQVIAEQLINAPLSEQLDIIHQFTVIGANATTRGFPALRTLETVDRENARPALKNSRAILRIMKDAASLPIIDFAVDSALKRLEKEEIDPNVGLVKLQGNRSEGRLIDYSHQEADEHNRLRTALIPDTLSPFENGGRLQVIARDAIGVFDHSGLPRSIGRFDVKNLPESVLVSPMDTQNIQEAIDRPDASDYKYIGKIVRGLRDRVVRRLQSEKTVEHSGSLGQAFYDFAPQLSVDQWDEILNGNAPEYDYRTHETWNILREQFTAFTECAKTYLAPINKEHREKLPTVHFDHYESLVSDESVFPFPIERGEDIMLLLQHLHRPAIREQIEESIGFSLRELPLRSQVHLLRYLAGEDADKFERLQGVFQSNQESAQVTAEAFFAVAESSKSGDDILDIAEYLQKNSPEEAQKIFSTYVQLVDQINQKSDQLLEVGRQVFDNLTSLSADVAQHLLRRVNHLFPTLITQLEDGVDPKLAVSQTIDAFHEEGDLLQQMTQEFINTAAEVKKAEHPRGSQLFLRLEQSFRHLVLGEQEYRLPSKLLVNLEQESQALESENLSDAEPLYFPVGISKDLPAWEGVWNGESKTAKPIEIFSYLFWLQNQGRSSRLVVCDTIQSSNYQKLYPDLLGDQPEKTAQEYAQRIGESEQVMYQAMCETFGLSNIEVQGYEPFITDQQERVDLYRTWCEQLSQDPNWVDAFTGMVQESVGHPMTLDEKKEYLPYAIEELSWIMAADGTKVSHPNEARYDAIATVLKNCEKLAEENQIDLHDSSQREAFNSLVYGVQRVLSDQLNRLKAKADKGSPTAQYCDAFRRHLGLIHLPNATRVPDNFDRKSVRLNVAIPSTGAQSFGWRSTGSQGEEGVRKFKEPYSTYFFRDGAELFLNSDQIVAVAKGTIAGKILALPPQEQERYTLEVVMPLLRHFFKVLDHAPQSYFDSVQSNREALIAECQKSRTLIDLLRFIQHYVVEPVESRLSTLAGTEFDNAA
ncbi:MAG: hypothetical protein WCW66_05880 [Patescibacteria group bacterium]